MKSSEHEDLELKRTAFRRCGKWLVCAICAWAATTFVNLAMGELPNFKASLPFMPLIVVASIAALDGFYAGAKFQAKRKESRERQQ